MLPQFAGKGFALAFAPLESVLPWRLALRVTLSLFALAFAWGFALVVLALDRQRRATAMLGFFIALPWSLYMGFFQFVVGTTFGLYTLAFVLRRAADHDLSSRAARAPAARPGRLPRLHRDPDRHIVLVLGVAAAPKEQRLREARTDGARRRARRSAPRAHLSSSATSARARSRPSSLVASPSASARSRGGSSRARALRAWLVIALVARRHRVTLVRARRGEATPIEHGARLARARVRRAHARAPLHMPGWQFLAPRFAILAMVLGLALVRLPELAVAARRARRSCPS